MFILALLLTALAAIWTMIVVFADSMRSSPQPPNAGLASMAALYLLAGVAWLAAFFN